MKISYISDLHLDFHVPFNMHEHSIFIHCYTELGINAMLWLVDDYLEGN